MRIAAVLAAATAAGCLSTPGQASPDAAVIDGPIDAEIDAPIDADVDAPIDGDIDAPGCTDGDGDGWWTCGTYPDCADGDPLQHPGAYEDMDQVDRDCDGSGHNTVRPRLQVTLFSGGDGAINVSTGSARYDLQDTAAHQLAQITVGGTALVYTNTDNSERWSGVHAWENDFSTQAPSETYAISMIHPGRGVYRVTVDWADGNLTNGRSIYTFTADGRLVRYDRFDAAQNAGSSLTDYVALRSGELSNLRWEELDGTEHDVTITPPTPPTEFVNLVGDTAGVDGFLCARTPGVREVGFTAVGTPTGRGLRAAVSSGGQVALQFDWTYWPFSAGRRTGYTMIYAGASSAATPCGESEIRARQFRQPVMITVDAGGSLPFEPEADLGPDGYFEEGGYFAIDANPGASSVEFHLMGGTGTTFGPYNLFRIDGLAAPGDDPVVMRGATRLVHGRDYYVDHEAGGRLWLYVMVSFGTDHIRVITPAASCPTCAK